MTARPLDDPRGEFRMIGLAIVTSAATTFAAELARWTIETVKERARRSGSEER